MWGRKGETGRGHETLNHFQRHVGLDLSNSIRGLWYRQAVCSSDVINTQAVSKTRRGVAGMWVGVGALLSEGLQKEGGLSLQKRGDTVLSLMGRAVEPRHHILSESTYAHTASLLHTNTGYKRDTT